MSADIVIKNNIRKKEVEWLDVLNKKIEEVRNLEVGVKPAVVTKTTSTTSGEVDDMFQRQNNLTEQLLDLCSDDMVELGQRILQQDMTITNIIDLLTNIINRVNKKQEGVNKEQKGVNKDLVTNINEFIKYVEDAENIHKASIDELLKNTGIFTSRLEDVKSLSTMDDIPMILCDLSKKAKEDLQDHVSKISNQSKIKQMFISAANPRFIDNLIEEYNKHWREKRSLITQQICNAISKYFATVDVNDVTLQKKISNDILTHIPEIFKYMYKDDC